MVQTGVITTEAQQSRRWNRFHLLFCGCRSKAVIHHVELAEEEARAFATKKLRATTSAATSVDGSPSPYDTVSSSDEEDRIVEVPLRGIQARPYSFRLPTREIVPDGSMPAISFLTIDPLLMSVSTDPYNNNDEAEYHDRRDDDYYNNKEVDDDDDISDVTGFRDYSLISM